MTAQNTETLVIRARKLVATLAVTDEFLHAAGADPAVFTPQEVAASHSAHGSVCDALVSVNRIYLWSLRPQALLAWDGSDYHEIDTHEVDTNGITTQRALEVIELHEQSLRESDSQRTLRKAMRRVLSGDFANPEGSHIACNPTGTPPSPGVPLPSTHA